MYPISLQASASRLVVCSKDSFISIMLSEPIQEVDLSRDPVLDLQLLEPIKVKLMEIPTCSKVGQFCIYFGMHSGTVSMI